MMMMRMSMILLFCSPDQDAERADAAPVAHVAEDGGDDDDGGDDSKGVDDDYDDDIAALYFRPGR